MADLPSISSDQERPINEEVDSTQTGDEENQTLGINPNPSTSTSTSSAAMLSEMKQKRRARAYGSHDTPNSPDDTDVPDVADTESRHSATTSSTNEHKVTKNENDEEGPENEEASDEDSVATVDAECNVDMFGVDDLEQAQSDDGNDSDLDADADADLAVGNGDSDPDDDEPDSESKGESNNGDEENNDETDMAQSNSNSDMEDNFQVAADEHDEEEESLVEDFTQKEELETDGLLPSQASSVDNNKPSSSLSDDDSDNESTKSATRSINGEMEETAPLKSPESPPLGSEPLNETKLETNVPVSPNKEKVTDEDVLDTVDVLFSEADIKNITVKDIIDSLQDLFQIKLKKKMKKQIKQRLVSLVNEQIASQANEGSNESNNDDHDGDDNNDEEDAASEGSEDGNNSEYSQDSDDEDDSTSNTKNRRKKSSTSKSKSRPKRTPKKRKPSHLKIHNESLRKRQIAQAKIRAEEMQQRQQNKMSEVDRNRAQAIAKRLQTDSEEMRFKRTEDRIGLLKILEEKRLMLLNASDIDVDANDNSDEKKFTPAKDNQTATSDSKSEKVPDFGKKLEMETEIDDCSMPETNKPKGNIDEEVDSGSESEYGSGSDSDSDDELEFISSDGNPAKALPAPNKQATATTVRRNSPKSVIAYFKNNEIAGGDERKPIAAKNMFKNPRASLRNALKAKQYEQGNTWLAR